jgi:hypothetical protein
LYYGNLHPINNLDMIQKFSILLKKFFFIYSIFKNFFFKNFLNIILLLKFRFNFFKKCQL